MDANLSDFLAVTGGRRGHFNLESGYHGELWLDLETLFADPGFIAPFVAALADRLRAYLPDVVCGPMVGGAFLAQAVATQLGAEFWFATRTAPRPMDSAFFSAEYRLPPALAKRARGKRVALVDDAMSAGSSLRATRAELDRAGAVPVAVGALIVFGDRGAGYFRDQALPVECLARDEYQMWSPDDCPMCRDGVPLEGVSG